MKRAVQVVCAFQLFLAFGVFRRMWRTRDGARIERVEPNPARAGWVSVIVPVLDEVDRLEPCLASLAAQGDVVREIVVVDGGSTDGTQEVVRTACARDPRIQPIDAAPVPDRINGKAYGLMIGSRAVSEQSPWLLTVDADVRLDPGAVGALLAHAERSGLRALSVATSQRIHGRLLGLLHPAMLTTLVYRFGIPGHSSHRSGDVQANGQCFLVHRGVLASVGGFQRVLGTVAEDAALARAIASTGEPVGFFESNGLVEVEMHRDGADAWRNWPRSLPLRDGFSTLQSSLRMADVFLVQAAPLVLLIASLKWDGRSSLAARVQLGLLVARLGVLAGTARAYPNRPATYWLSPLVDLPVAVEIVRRAVRREHVWRGRMIATGAPQ